MNKSWDTVVVTSVIVGSFNLLVALFCIVTAFLLHSSYFMIPNLLLGAINLVCVWVNYKLAHDMYKNLKEGL